MESGHSWIIRTRKNRWFWNFSAVCSSHTILIREVDKYQNHYYLRPLFHFSSFNFLVFLNFSGHNFVRDADILLHFIFGIFQQFQSEFQSHIYYSKILFLCVSGIIQLTLPIYSTFQVNMERTLDIKKGVRRYLIAKPI